MPFRLKDFAFFYSLQVGVVVFSLLGMVIHTVALLKYFFNSVTETSPKDTVYQYVISLVFIVLGLAIYILGLTGSALENSKILRVGGSLLVIETVYWIILMGISFSGKCQLVRRVCVDNRCPERLYLQNGYWRPTVQECNNKSDNSSSNNNGSNEGPISFAYVRAEGVISETNTTDQESTNTAETTATNDIKTTAGNDTETAATNDTKYAASNAAETTATNTATETRPTSPANSTNGTQDDLRHDDDIDVLWTPIGELKSNPHFSLSVAYAVLIIFVWYLYPIWLFFSFATQIDYDEM